jgi:hypothetical protein
MTKKIEVQGLEEQAQEILSLLRSNWAMGKSPTTGRFWLQEGGLASGGNSRNVAEDVIEYMTTNAYIKSDGETRLGYRVEYFENKS